VDTSAIVIFGAAVRADGRPSASLARRIGYGLRAWRELGDPILCSGAAGRYGPSEAWVMAAELKREGVPAERIFLDEDSRDTFQSVIAAARFVKARGLSRCMVCSDAYHVPRIRLLLAVLGVKTVVGPVPAGPAGGWRHWLRMSLREALAIPYDLALVLVRRGRLLAAIRPGG
jgi:uncharacterized SAM-binding protein YcdF (DUF218 family)